MSSLSSKKWILDLKSDEISTDPLKTEPIQDLAKQIFESVPVLVQDSNFFINSETWMSLSIEAAYNMLSADEHCRLPKGQQFCNWLVFENVFLFQSIIWTKDDASIESSIKYLNLVNLETLKRIEESNEELESTKISSKFVEIFSDFFIFLSKHLDIISSQTILKLLEYIDFISERLKIISPVMLDGLQTCFSSTLMKSKQIISINVFASLLIQISIKLFKNKYKDPIKPNNQDLQNYCNSTIQEIAFEAPNSVVQDSLLHLSQFTNDRFIQYKLALLVIYYANRTEEDYTDSEKDKNSKLIQLIEPNSISTHLAHLIISDSSIGLSCIKNLFESTQRLFDDITKSNLAIELLDLLTNAELSPAVKQSVSIIINSMSIGENLSYIHHWLYSFIDRNSLDSILTRCESSEELASMTKPISSNLNFMDLLISNSNQHGDQSIMIDHTNYNDLVATIIERLNVPDYFFYLNETKSFDPTNFSFAQKRASTFHILVPHYWRLLEYVLCRSPSLQELVLDNPITILPEGVPRPIEVPSWLDSLFVTFSLHSAKLDYYNSKTSAACSTTLNSFMQSSLLKQLPKHVLVIRFRSITQLIKSQKSIDEKSKFYLIMWICSQLPLHLLDKTDGFDVMVANVFIELILEALQDYRPEIKLLAMELLSSICSTPIGASYMPKSIFDAMVKSLNFREPKIVQLSLETCQNIIRSHSNAPLVDSQSETQIENDIRSSKIQIQWSTELMSVINYELDYVQKPEIIILYLDSLKSLLPLMETKVFSYLHPLIVRIVALLDLGSIRMVSSCLELLIVLLTQGWPRISLESELLFGGLATCWVDHVWAGTSKADVPEIVKTNIENIKKLIIKCVRLMSAIVDQNQMKKLESQLVGLEELRELKEIVSSNLETFSTNSTLNQSNLLDRSTNLCVILNTPILSIMEQTPSDSPILVKQFAAEIDDIHTDFILNSYDDRYFFIITQLGKLGTLIKAEKDATIEGESTYEVRTLLGSRNDEAMEALALQLINLIGETSNKPLLLSIALKHLANGRSITPSTFKSILKLVLANRIW